MLSSTPGLVVAPCCPPLACKVYTPGDLARAIVGCLDDGASAVWLEPSHGRGAFLEAIAGRGIGKNRILAIDLDRERSSADRLAITRRGVDFLRWAKQCRRRFDRIVGNPPFVPISQLPLELQQSAATVLDLGGEPIGKASNLWYAFVLTCFRLLKQGGSIALVLPSAAEFADYCSAIRRNAVEHFERLDLYRCQRPLFDEVQEGTLVAIAKGYGSGPGLIRRRQFPTRAALIRGLSDNASNGRVCSGPKTVRSRLSVELQSIAKVGLGGVTGDASFFLMNESKRAVLGLPLAAVTPVVSRARHLRSARLTEQHWQSLKASGERVWLFNPPSRLLRNEGVKRYLSLEHAAGGCNRDAHKILSRDPWYRTPMPATPDAFISGMSQAGPWFCINETQAVNATNTLYVLHFHTDNRQEWYKWALAFLSSEVRRQVRAVARRYPGGLIKYEPGALGRILVPIPIATTDYMAVYLKAVSALTAGKPAVARVLADNSIRC